LHTDVWSNARRKSGWNGTADERRLLWEIIDSITNKPIEAASVQLIQNKYDSVEKKRKEVIVDGMLTKGNGQFNFEGVPIMGQYKLRISAIGFKSYERNVALVNPAAFRNNNNANQDLASMLGNFDKDLGNIKLEIDQKVLANVTVTGRNHCCNWELTAKFIMLKRT
jgi:hypothetical protein